MYAGRHCSVFVAAAVFSSFVLAACQSDPTAGNATAFHTSSHVQSDPPTHGTEIAAATGSGPASGSATQTASGCQVVTSSSSTSAAATSIGRMVSGSVPPPPLGRQLRASEMTIGPSAAGTTSATSAAGDAVIPALPLLGQPTMHLYESPCSPGELIVFYTETLTGEGWTGSFVMPSASPFASFSATTTNTSVSAGGATSAGLPRPLAGNFVGATNDGLMVVMIELRPVQASSGVSATSPGPTYVQIILQAIPYSGAVQGT